MTGTRTRWTPCGRRGVGELRQREPRLEIPSLTRAVRGFPCTFRVPGVCAGGTDTTVWCHSNEEQHGKGKGLKSHDCHGAAGCYACHLWYDTTRDAQRAEVFRQAKDRTLYLLFKEGKLKVGAVIRVLYGRTPPYYRRLSYWGRAAQYTIRVLPSWQSWRERRGVARMVWGKP